MIESYAVKKIRRTLQQGSDHIENGVEYIVDSIEEFKDIIIDGVGNVLHFAGKTFKLNACRTDLSKVPHLLASEVFPSTKLINLPLVLDYRSDLGFIRQQGDRPICVGITGATIKEWQEKKSGDFPLVNGRINFSPEYIYSCRENPEVEGMSGNNLMTVLQNNGVPTEQTYEEASKDPRNGALHKKMKIESAKCMIQDFALLDSVEATKTALYKNGPCAIIVPCFNNTTRMWIPEKNGDVALGGHCMTIVGYTNNGFIIQNSWGSGWGENGYCMFPFADWGKQWEAWTCVDGQSSLVSADRVSTSCLQLCSCTIM